MRCLWYLLGELGMVALLALRNVLVMLVLPAQKGWLTLHRLQARVSRVLLVLL